MRRISFHPGGTRRGYPPQAGFTLLELVITVAVLAIALGIAIPSFQGITNRNRLTGVTNELVAAVQLTRMEAIRRNARVTLCPSTDGAVCGGDNWMRSIVLAPDGTVVREFQFSGRGLTIVPSSNVDNGDRISFGANGFARAGSNAANRAGGLRVCTTVLGAAENSRDVMINVARISVSTPAGSADCSGAPANG